jgi:DNA repair photolyase
MHPRIVGNALELLNEELPKLKDDIHFIHLSFMTDPFMYDAVNIHNFPWVEELTLRIIERVNKEGLKVTVLTKGLCPETLTTPKYDKGNEFGITLVSVDDDFHRRFEPFSAPPLERISALERLHDQGLKTWVSLEPYPTPNIVKQNLSDILAEVSFVDKIVFGKWNYSSLASGYPQNEVFYRERADEVIRFAKENDMVYHIKDGTPRSSNETENLFHG